MFQFLCEKRTKVEKWNLKIDTKNMVLETGIDKNNYKVEIRKFLSMPEEIQ